MAHDEWQRTEVNAGTFEYIFNATASHNPSFWEFYLTKPVADLNKALAWSDLELIESYGNVPITGGKYRMDVSIPTDRVGDALYMYGGNASIQSGKASITAVILLL